MSAVSFLWLGSIGGAGIAFLTQVVLARELAPSDYGVFSAALATITLLSPLAGFGVQSLWLKLFGAEGWGAIRWLLASLRFVVISTFVTLGLIMGWATFGGHNTTTQYILYLLLPVPIGVLCTTLVSGKLQLEERFKALALWQALPHLYRLLLLIGVIMLTKQTGLGEVAVVYTSVAFLIVLFSFIPLRRMIMGHFELKGHPRPNETELVGPRVGMLDVARDAWPFGLAGLFYLIYFQSDVILLEYISGGEAAGIYNVAFTVMAAVYLLPSVIYQKFLLPKFHRWANHDRALFLRVYRAGNGSMLLLGGLTTIAMLVLVPICVPLLFGIDYQPAVNLLCLLAFCAPIRFLATSIGATLVTQEHMCRKIFYMGSVAVINLALNAILIPLYSAKGAAVATILSEAALLLFYLYAVRRHVFGPEAWRGWTVTLRSRGHEA